MSYWFAGTRTRFRVFEHRATKTGRLKRAVGNNDYNITERASRILIIGSKARVQT